MAYIQIDLDEEKLAFVTNHRPGLMGRLLTEEMNRRKSLIQLEEYVLKDKVLTKEFKSSFLRVVDNFRRGI